MTSLRHTALGLALGLAFATNAMAVTTIPFWHSMEGELGKEVAGNYFHPCQLPKFQSFRCH